MPSTRLNCQAGPMGQKLEVSHRYSSAKGLYMVLIVSAQKANDNVIKVFFAHFDSLLIDVLSWRAKLFLRRDGRT